MRLRLLISALDSIALALAVSLVVAGSASGQVSQVIDIAALPTGPGGSLHRTYGSTGTGDFGVPVAGGHDMDEDGFTDFAFAAFTADPFGRTNAGEVYLIFGDGTTTGVLDTAVSDARILVIAGVGITEYAGSEIWMDDVTGDGVGDLLVARQNFDPGSRVGAGALTIVVGGSALADHAATGEPLDLGAPPVGITLVTLVGAADCDRLGIWVRTGDVTGDDVADIVVGADTEGSSHRGAAYVVRGGAHLLTAGTVDLANFGTTTLAGDLARIRPRMAAGDESHFGATVQIGDLDGDGAAEVLVAATLNRAGASLAPAGGGCSPVHGSGGETSDGTLYIVWDDNFTGDPWADGYAFRIDDAPGTTTRIDGNASAANFGEEILAGFDFDADGDPDLFVGDIVGDQSPIHNRSFSGYGYVFYDAAGLAGLDFDMGNPPQGLVVSLIQGARSGDLAADTAAAGDFDGDGIDDLAIASPHFDPQADPVRSSAGGYHVLHGQVGVWPAYVDLLAPPPPEMVKVSEVWGVKGTVSGNTGDTLGYSAATGYIDGDDRLDLISNEMVGDGVVLPDTIDVGNVIVLSGAVFVPEPGAFGLTVAAMLTVAWIRRRTR